MRSINIYQDHPSLTTFTAKGLIYFTGRESILTESVLVCEFYTRTPGHYLSLP